MARKTGETISARDRQAAGALLILSGSVSLALTMQAQGASSALGQICGHLGLFALHCPVCYAAAAAIAAGLFLATARGGRPARLVKAMSVGETRAPT